MKQIREHLTEGKSSSEVIALGYMRGSVYKVLYQMRQEGNGGSSTSSHVSPQGSKPQGDGGPKTRRTVQPRDYEPPDLQIETDPEIVQLNKEIRRAELEKQLGRLKAPPEMETIVALARELGSLKRIFCGCREDGICTYEGWDNEEDIPTGIGEPAKRDDRWYVKPSLLCCAFCFVTDDLTQTFRR